MGKCWGTATVTITCPVTRVPAPLPISLLASPLSDLGEPSPLACFGDPLPPILGGNDPQRVQAAGPQRHQGQWVHGGLISLANPNSPLSITSAPTPGGGWQPGWQGPPGWPGTANALTHDTHVPARGKAIGGERGCRSPKYPGVPDTGDYRFTDGTIAQPGLSRLPAQHQNPPKPPPSPFPLPPHANHPTVVSGCWVPATLAGPLVPFPVGFSPNWVFSQSIEAKCIV